MSSKPVIAKHPKGNKLAFVKFVFVNNYMNFQELKLRLADIRSSYIIKW